MKDRKHILPHQPSRLLAASATLVLLLAGAADAHQKLYVLDSAKDTVTVVDVASSRILGHITVGAQPHGVASPASQDVLYVSIEGEDLLVKIDPMKDVVLARYTVGGRPNEIEITSDGRLIYVPSLRDGVYEVFDTRQEKIIARIPTDGFPHNAVVSPDNRFVYLSPMDRGEYTAEQIEGAGLPTTLNEKLYVVDTGTQTVLATVPLADAPRPIAVHPSGDRLFVNRDGLLGFEVVDLGERRVVATARYELTREERATPSRSHGIGVTPDGKEVWSTDINNAAVHVFDVSEQEPKEIARLPTGRTPLWLTVAPDGATVFVANTADDSISAFDTASKTERTRIQMAKGAAPKRMLVVDVPEGDGASTER